MAGRKFGAEGDLSLTWAMNSHVPALVARLSQLPHRRVLDRLRLSLRARGRRRLERGHGARSARRICAVLRRARAHVRIFFGKFSTPGRLFRLNYSIDMRYGVLHDIAMKVLQASRSTSASAMSISSGRGMPRRRRCAVSPIATRRPRQSMSAVTRSLPCAISQRNSAGISAGSRFRRPRAADGLADQHITGGETVRPARRRHRADDRVDRRLGLARDAEPRQADQIRGARWPLLTSRHRQARRR